MNALLQRFEQTLAGKTLRQSKDAEQEYEEGSKDCDEFPS
jgi:hypothetical protein